MSRSALIAPITLITLLFAATPLLAQQAPAPVRPEVRMVPAARAGTAYLGVRAGEVNEETRSRFGIPVDVARGIVLTEVLEGTAAARAGLRAGDVVTKFGGASLVNPGQLSETVRARKPGDKVTYVVRRGSGTIAGTLTMGERPASAETMVPVAPHAPKATEAPRAVPEGALDERLDRVQADIERLREKLLKARREVDGPRIERARRPRGIEGWLHREELAAVKAREAGDRERVRWHEARLSILREFKAAGMEIPAQRLHRIERKLDAILKSLKAQQEPPKPKTGVRIR